jgi:hypothetical protein
MKKSTLTENKAEQTPTGGVLVGKREGQTIIHNKGTLSGYLVGKTHAEGGIKAVNKSTGQPLEMQGGEVVITAPAVSDNTKNEFNGKMMTNREILSTINEKGGGVAFAKDGMEIPKNIKRTGASYKYGGKTMTDHEIYKHITGGHLAKGKTLPQIAKMHKVSLKELQRQVDMGMKAESEHTSSKREQMKIVKDHLFENPKYYSLLKRAGLKDGGAVSRESLVKNAKSGNTPARDLNNYNDVLDVDADGMVGAETGLYAKGGATDVVVDNWNDIPDTFKKIRLLKKIDWQEIPSDDGLNEIAKPFLDADKLRPTMTGINFDENGITFTNAHILLTIPTIAHDYKGIYKKTKTGVEIIDGTYPLYPRIIANEKEITKVFYIDILKLLTYCKVAKNYSGAREIVFKINNETMAFFPDLMINFLSSLIKLTGDTYWNVSFNKTNKQPLIFTKYPSYEVGRDIIGLIMPFVGDASKYGARNPDTNADLNVYFDFDNNEIVNVDGSTVDLDVKPTTQRAKRTPKANPSQTEKPKRNFELERKYLSQRISDLAKELDLKKPILSNEEVAFYQREINLFILKLRKLNDAEMSLKPIEERVRGVYRLKFASFDNEYSETDMTSINALKSQLTEKEYFNVRTPEFKSFFGDWETAYLNDSYAGVSKVVNPITKEPQPVFHGTNVLFVNWKTYDSNNAHYFAVKREFSEFFATTWEERTDKAGVDSQILKKLNPNKGRFLFRCFIDVKNPIDFSRFGVEKYPIREFLTFLRVNYNIGDFDFWTNITTHSGLTQDTEVYAWQIIRLWQSFTKYVKVFTTYDGYIFYEYIPTKPYGGLENASLSYCAFDSNQIKFTDAYEFNALSNDSRFDLGGIL